MAQLTDHFAEEELRAQFAPMVVKGCARILCAELLEPIRDHYGKALIVTSGYRTLQQNKAAGGEPTSFHLYEDGKAAADFDVPGISAEDVFNWIRLESGLKFDKVILEYKHGIPDIVHIQLDVNAKARRLAYTGNTAGMFNGRKYIAMEVGPSEAASGASA